MIFGVALSLMGALPASSAEAAEQEEFTFTPSMTSTDNDDGTYDIPLLKSDVPDVSVTRVPADENDEGRDIYYMVSTTMHLSPGAPIMKSYDLVNWEIVNYAYDRISVGDAFSLRDGKSSYGEGQWATSIRYHDGRVFVLFNTNNLNGAYMLHTDDPENGVWERVEFGRFMHDPTLFFDEANDGAPYVFFGNREQFVVKLVPDQDWAIVERYDDEPVFSQDEYTAEWTKGLFEGSQLAYIDGMYYMVMITSGSGWARQVLILRSPYLLGRYDERSGGQNTYEDHSGLNSNGYAQGSLVEVANDDGTTTWHGFFFRDTYPGGRIPALIPATWPEPQDPDPDAVEIGENIVVNGSFDNCITDGWGTEYTATIEAVEVETDDCALYVSDRVNNGSGPSQSIGAHLVADAKYEFSARFKYEDVSSGEVPENATFQLLLKGSPNVGGLDGNGLLKVGEVTATAGEWVTAAATWEAPAELAGENLKFVVETPWSADNESARVNYFVDDVSITSTEDDEAPWPVFGRDGVVGYPDTFDHLISLSEAEQNLARSKSIVTSDDFFNDVERQPWTHEYERWSLEGEDLAEVAYNGSNLRAQWEWNHAPDNRYWSLTDRDCWLRLTTTGVVICEANHRGGGDNEGQLTYLEEARNTLSQRVIVPAMSAETRLDFSQLSDGDTAGLAVFNRAFAYAAVRNIDGEPALGLVERTPSDVSGQLTDMDPAAVETFQEVIDVPDGQQDVYLRVDTEAVDGQPLKAWWHYSWDGENWAPLGEETQASFAGWHPTHFMGPRIGLFNYATKEKGGVADFDYLYLSDTSRDEPVTDEKLQSIIEIGRAHV